MSDSILALTRKARRRLRPACLRPARFKIRFAPD